MEMNISKQASKEKKFVAADLQKCTGCRVCELVCALENEKAFDPKLARIRVLGLNQIMNMPVACKFCEDAPCVRSCSRDALSQIEDTGITVVDDAKCDFCEWGYRSL